MDLIGQETCPLPEDPQLAEAASALNEAGTWTQIVDRNWRWAYMSDDARLSQGGLLELVPVPLGAHYFGSESSHVFGTVFSLETFSEALAALGSWVLADTPGGRDELRALVDPDLRDVVDEITTTDRSTAITFPIHGSYSPGGDRLPFMITAQRMRGPAGDHVGTILQAKPSAGMSVLGTMSSAGDLGHFARMQGVAKAGRRPAAILFADLEGSSPLARRLSTAGYFALSRRLVRAADACVVDAGGIVGRHVGDGVVAFFLAETAGSESAAARACIAAARALRAEVDSVATRSDLEPGEITLRFGLHWGSTLFVGQIATRGRSEVTALGAEVNEAARIEACAGGGRALASKDLVERLEPGDCAALELDPTHVTYTALGDLRTATEKARRDAPVIAVCEV
jgi:class 3 adenylate cyclase